MRKIKDGDVHLLEGDPPIAVRIRRSERARRFSLSVSRTDGQARLSLPVWAKRGEALDFLYAREDWLRRHVAAAPVARRPAIGGTVPIAGQERPIRPASGRAARFTGGEVLAPDGARLGPAIRALLIAMARDRLTEAVAGYSRRLGRDPGRLSLRDTRSRWGSCTSRGDLMFSWRLAMAPPEVLDYVAAHETAHLIEMNHGPAFWRICRDLCPETDAHRLWLRREGPRLLSWRFDPADENGA